jgi:PAS domain S-box-containing protein
MGPGVRPVLAAVVDAQPLPTFAFGGDGGLLACSSSARWLCAAEGEAGRRVVAHDGTDLWTIISARADEARPDFDVRVRLRCSEGQLTDTTLTVMPLRGEGGGLAGALAFVTTAATERCPGAQDAERAAIERDGYRDAFERIVGSAGIMSGADCMLLAGLDADDHDAASLLATWGCDGYAPGPENEPAYAQAATLASVMRGRPFAHLTDDAVDAMVVDPVLAGQGFRTFIGVTLTDADGHRLGVLGGFWRAQPPDVAGASAVLHIQGARAAAALARLSAQQELKESEQRYGAVFEGSAVPILLIEPSTTQIVEANPAACAFYGHTCDDLVTMSVLQLDATGPEAAQAELALAAQGARARFYAKHRVADGVLRDVEVSTGLIVVGGRKLLYSMVADITERLRMEAEIDRHQRSLEAVVRQRTQDLLRANAELQQASVAREMILATLTQEVRTSLQTITGFSELMLEGMAGDLTGEQRIQTGMVLDAGRRLSAFLESLTERQRSEELELRCEPEHIDLVSLVESAVFGLESFATEKGLSITMVAEHRPVEVETDRYKLQNVLLNLLSNAIRYTERGAVSVTVEESDDSGSTITVADTGVGIDPARLDSLFEDSAQQDPEGGLGLPASRRLAEAIGARIEAESTPGRGSVFTLHLPDRCVAGPDDTVAPEDASEPGEGGDA